LPGVVAARTWRLRALPRILSTLPHWIDALARVLSALARRLDALAGVLAALAGVGATMARRIHAPALLLQTAGCLLRHWGRSLRGLWRFVD
jgi:hypothetical protein